MKNQILLLLTLAVIMLGGNANSTIGAEPPHPYHVSLAEVNWNTKSHKFEVALCLWPADLEKALARQTGRPIDLEKEANIDQLMEAYIGKQFTIHSTNERTKKLETKQNTPANALTGGKTANPTAAKTQKSVVAAKADSPAEPSKMKWFGHEADAKQVWLYFEIAGEPGTNGLLRIEFSLNSTTTSSITFSGTVPAKQKLWFAMRTTLELFCQKNRLLGQKVLS